MTDSLKLVKSILTILPALDIRQALGLHDIFHFILATDLPDRPNKPFSMNAIDRGICPFFRMVLFLFITVYANTNKI
jgi:hypothetical protein